MNDIWLPVVWGEVAVSILLALAVARCAWLCKKPKTEPGPGRPSELTPGCCECGHMRCCHSGGAGKCAVGYPPSAEWPNGSQCACAVFIFDPDADDDDEDGDTPTPSPEELERLYRG